MNEVDDSLAQAAREHRIITTRCRSCGNAASFLACDLADFADPATPVRAIRFRCTGCNGRDYEIGSLEVDRDRRPDIIVWRPTRLR